MKQAKIPYALEFEAAFARVYAAVPTMVYVGWCVESWERVYPMFRGCSAIAQDYSGTATGTELLELLEANDTGTNTIVEGPANSDTLLRLGAVCTTQNWGAYERLKQHQGLKVCLCNEPNHPEFYDLDMWGLPFEGNADKPGWGPHWAARCRADGVVPVFPVFTANGLVNAEQFRTPAPVDRE